MSSGERPIGAAKGKQSDTEALCQPPPPPPHPLQSPPPPQWGGPSLGPKAWETLGAEEKFSLGYTGMGGGTW